jgi:hypothetical protein
VGTSSVRSHRKLVALVSVALTFTLLSVAAVADRASGFRGFIPRPITQALAWFIEPGLTVWWFTLGTVFQSFPYNFLGYAVTVGANVVVWLFVVVFVWGIARRLHQGAAHSK